MAINKYLESSVLKHMSIYAFNNDARFKQIAKGNVDLGIVIMAKNENPFLRMDKNFKVRICVGNMIGCGYDFRQPTDEVRTAGELYKAEISIIKLISVRNLPKYEKFLDGGIDNEIIGWYLIKPFKDWPLLFEEP